MAVAPSLKLSSMAVCSPSFLRSSSTSKTTPPRLVSSSATPTYFTRFSFSPFSLSLSTFFLSWTKNKVPLSLCTVSKTSNLAWQDEEEEVSGWEWGKEAEEGSEEEGFAEGETEEEGFPDPSAETKLFVGNLPYDVNSEKLARLFENSGIVKISEVIYSRVTGHSRGFGFVTMSTVEEAENAIEMLNHYDLNGKLLVVNKAVPRGSVTQRPRLEGFEPSFRIYVGNLPWEVDCAGWYTHRETGRSRGFGFVSMSSKGEVDDAIAALDGQKAVSDFLHVPSGEIQRSRESPRSVVEPHFTAGDVSIVASSGQRFPANFLLSWLLASPVLEKMLSLPQKRGSLGRAIIDPECPTRSLDFLRLLLRCRLGQGTVGGERYAPGDLGPFLHAYSVMAEGTVRGCFCADESGLEDAVDVMNLAKLRDAPRSSLRCPPSRRRTSTSCSGLRGGGSVQESTTHGWSGGAAVYSGNGAAPEEMEEGEGGPGRCSGSSAKPSAVWSTFAPRAAPRSWPQ
ncbi:hypothetical protein HPP92_023875 [Vanilla planifolia]|uniref:RRM domain-containing protein n=1 Tax=Vanilla planifolia TaxID=51239 RepID=A0A835PU04_VANPL|nr:hypothetical protein HPP92_023875 [Vanilla planifolia]